MPHRDRRGPAPPAGDVTVAGRRGLHFDRRRREHLAVLSAIFVVSAFGYLMLPPRTVQLQVDGASATLRTHSGNDVAVLEAAGYDLRPGDRLTALDGEGRDVLRVERAHAVRLTADGQAFEIRTHAATVEQLLEEAGVVAGDRDSVLIDGVLVSPAAPLRQPRLVARGFTDDPDEDDGLDVDVRRAVPFTIVTDAGETLSTSSRPNVVQALREAGVTVGPGDRVTPDPAAPLEPDARIEVRRALAITVALPSEHRAVYTFAGTVGDALAEAGIVLPPDAFVEPAPESPISQGMAVRVVQLSASSDEEREFIESSTVYRSDPSLGPGQTRTEAGRDGVLVRRYDIGYVNGEEATRTLAEEYYDPEPQDTVIYYPEQRGGGDAAPADGSIVQTMRVYATWYNPASAGRPASDPAYGRTATGVQVTYGVVAVDPDIIPLGTRMFIPGYGYAVAADTGGAVQGYIIDLGYPDGVAVDWSSRWLDIYILS